jgi:hypothetical protein
VIAVSFIQVLLAVSVFLGAIGMVVGLLVIAVTLFVDEGYSGWWVWPSWLAAEALVLSTFIWLGAGPLNSP